MQAFVSPGHWVQTCFHCGRHILIDRCRGWGWLSWFFRVEDTMFWRTRISHLHRLTDRTGVADADRSPFSDRSAFSSGNINQSLSAPGLYTCCAYYMWRWHNDFSCSRLLQTLFCGIPYRLLTKQNIGQQIFLFFLLVIESINFVTIPLAQMSQGLFSDLWHGRQMSVQSLLS